MYGSGVGDKPDHTDNPGVQAVNDAVDAVTSASITGSNAASFSDLLDKLFPGNKQVESDRPNEEFIGPMPSTDYNANNGGLV